MMLDILKGDAFQLTELTKAINRMPRVPTKIGGYGWFSERGIHTLSVAIELRNGKLTLVQTKPRGAPGAVKTVERRNIRDLRTVHLPQRFAVMADEILGLREFGAERDLATMQAYINDKMRVPRTDLDLTHEFQRMGAVKGLVLDADGSTIYNYFTEFGLTQTSHVLALGTTTTKVRGELTKAKRKAEKKLGGINVASWHVLAGSNWFDLFVDHDDVRTEFRTDRSDVNRADLRRGVVYGDVFVEEYVGTVAASTPGGAEADLNMVDPDEAYMVPMGIPGMFDTYYSPADYMETVGTTGIPMYVKPKEMEFNKGIEYEVQSNPLHLNSYPEAVVHLTLT